MKLKETRITLKKKVFPGCSLEIPDITDFYFMDRDAYPWCCKKTVCVHYCQTDI